VTVGFAVKPKQQIMCSRLFGYPVDELSGLSKAVAEFASDVAIKLRLQRSLVRKPTMTCMTLPINGERSIGCWCVGLPGIIAASWTGWCVNYYQ